jgi:probable O-glycosylation ligase (exosortase A-associated)
MRDLAILLILCGMAWLAWLRPWLGVLGLAVLSAMHPQSYASENLDVFPMYKALFIVTISAAVFHFWREKRWPTLFWDWRFAVVVLLALDFYLTAMFGLLPYTSRDRWFEIMLLLLPWIPLFLLVDTREKLTAVMVATALSIALVALKGGFWALMTGFQDRVYGPPGSQIGGNNEFSVALAMAIPLLVFWLRQVRDRVLHLVIIGSIVLCYIAALTSWSRGGLVTLAAMTTLLVWHSKRKYLALPFIAIGIGIAFVNLPEEWHERMGTLATFEQDQSFQGRVWAWERGMAYVRADPLTGVGLDGWKEVNLNLTRETPAALDWHSAYVEILVEHGIPGFILWATLLFGTLASLSWLVRQARLSRSAWTHDASAMLRASLVAYAVGGLTLGTAYWELLYLFLAFAILVSRLFATEGARLASKASN